MLNFYFDGPTLLWKSNIYMLYQANDILTPLWSVSDYVVFNP